MRVAVLDDYQHVAMTSADWTQLPGDVTVTCFTDHLPDPTALGERLAGAAEHPQREPREVALLGVTPRWLGRCLGSRRCDRHTDL